MYRISLTRYRLDHNGREMERHGTLKMGVYADTIDEAKEKARVVSGPLVGPGTGGEKWWFAVGSVEEVPPTALLSTLRDVLL